MRKLRPITNKKGLMFAKRTMGLLFGFTRVFVCDHSFFMKRVHTIM